MEFERKSDRDPKRRVYCCAMNSARRFLVLAMLATMAGAFLSLAIVWSL